MKRVNYQFHFPFGIVLLIFFYNGIYCQKSYKIEQLPASINSDYEEIKPFSSSGGDSLYFLRSYSPNNHGGEYAGEDIWLSVFKEGSGWSKATNTFGYLNHTGPDIFIGLSCEDRFVYTLDYLHAGQNRFIKIVKHNIQYPERNEKIPEPYTRIEIGDDYHDLYLNPEGTVLFISMNALNSFGFEDIYISLKDEEGIWSHPVNLGPNINSRGFEISPFLSEDSQTLYFASDGHKGLGDADIFYCQRLDNDWQNWSKPVNMGSPFNSPHFDAYLSINKKHDIFFASNRNSNYSNIFKITERKEVFSDKQTQKKDNVAYAFSESNSDASKILDESLIISVYFEFDEFKLRKEEQEKLGKFAQKIMASQQSDFEIYGYTDDYGSQSYNIKLSEKRARFVYRYLKRSGIDEDRLYMEGKGIFTTPENKEIPASAKRKVVITGISGSAR